MKLKVNAILDPTFAPLALVCREMREKTKNDGQDIVIAIERNSGNIYTYKTRIFKDGTGNDELNFDFVERITKALLWVAGGFKIYIAGSETVGNKIKEAYKYGGTREFDVRTMEKVYEKPFEVVVCSLEDAPEEKSLAVSIGRNLDGCRIGFDAGVDPEHFSASFNLRYGKILSVAVRDNAEIEMTGAAQGGQDSSNASTSTSSGIKIKIGNFHSVRNRH